jgi:glycosyltransferase involved in cell wall biosynthesis
VKWRLSREQCAPDRHDMSEPEVSERLDVSVIICAYTLERWTELSAAIDSVRRQTVPPLETILVLDDDPELLRRACAAFGDLVIIKNAGGRGLSHARNTGCAAARGSIVAFLDDDTVAATDWLERLRAHYADARVVGVGGHIEPMWLTNRPTWFPEEFGWVVGCAYRGQPECLAPVRNLIGANMSFKRSVVDALGGFRTDIGRVGTAMRHCEDTEFCIRIGQRWPDSILLYEPSAIVHHRVPAARVRWSYFQARCFTEGQAKALLSRSLGARDALKSERAYTRSALPKGVWRGLNDAVSGQDACGLLRAGVILAGAVLTGAGYLAGRLPPALAQG